jgi:hypothetical protein
MLNWIRVRFRRQLVEKSRLISLIILRRNRLYTNYKTAKMGMQTFF